MPQEQSDPVQIYQTATNQARTVLQRVKPEQMKQSTPCSEWDVEALINHLVTAQNGIAGTVSGSQVATGSTPLETLDAAVSAMVAAANAPGGLEKKVQGRQGEVPRRPNAEHRHHGRLPPHLGPGEGDGPGHHPGRRGGRAYLPGG